MTYNKSLKNIPPSIFYGIFVILVVSACNHSTQLPTRFTLLTPEQSGISFANNLQEDSSNNILDYLYFYNGGGVAIGDLDNNGLPDIFFTSNQGANKLYLNKGNLQFEDISRKAGIAGKANWKTGVTMADINGDGLLDIYVSAVGNYKNFSGRNELFINQGNGNFSEQAEMFGLAVEGFNTQASFFDYDRDGDLDVFIVNHSVHSTETYVDSSERRKPNAYAGDKLLRCDQQGDSIFYTEVTARAGIYSSALGYGLNVLTADFNNDQWPDIYVSNDFHENDYYYLNNRDGSFRELNRESFGHESRFSMGSDVGDINNDGWLDLITLDMLPGDEKVLKSSAGDDPPDIYDFKMSKGYHHQYSKNCLQLNTNAGKHFSDISLFAGVAATDWSWSPLFADFDNDGTQDLFVSNGILRRPNDIDYIKYISSGSARELLQRGKTADQSVITKMPSGKVVNKLYKGMTGMMFADSGAAWGITAPSLSNGAIYADLDLDGDLDIITNNLNEPASVYINHSNEPANQQTGIRKNVVGHFIQIKLQGKGMNSLGYGSRVTIKTGGQIQTRYITASHGFQSAYAGNVQFGLGAAGMIDSLEIAWPDSTVQIITNLNSDTLIRLNQDDAIVQASRLLKLPATDEQRLLVQMDSRLTGLNYVHHEDDFNDFDIQQLIPQAISTQGPKMAIADINNDGLQDLFVCGAAAQPGSIYLQQAGKRFRRLPQPGFDTDVAAEDVNAVFFDADGDGDQDLYVVSGGNEYCDKEAVLLDRLYINDSKGNFYKSGGLPLFFGNKSTVVPIDIDKDGDTDLFVGGRVNGCSYGKIPDSYLLLNNGKGVFGIVTDQLAPGLKNIGMVSAACMTDIDKDGWQDLIVVGSWMPVTVFRNNRGRLENVTDQLGLHNTAGLWNTVLARDLNGDGYEELLVGNQGLNSKLAASALHPLQLFAGDIDQNGAWDQVLSVSKNGRYHPFLGKEELERVLPGPIRKKYSDYTSMAGQTTDEVFPGIASSNITLKATMLASMIIFNKKGKLQLSPLPDQVQWSPVFSFETGDVDGDGNIDILCGGNFYGVLPFEGRYDANAATVLLNKNDRYQSQLPFQSGITDNGETRDIRGIQVGNERWYAVAQNNAPLLVYRPTRSAYAKPTIAKRITR